MSLSGPDVVVKVRRMQDQELKQSEPNSGFQKNKTGNN